MREDNSIKRWSAKRKAAVVMDIFKGKTETQEAMRRQVFKYTELGNSRQCRHSAIGMIIPEAFEAG